MEEKRVGSKKYSIRPSVLESIDKTFEIEGVIKLVLSNTTQKSIGCVVGEDITADSNWILVPKEKLSDNLELHEGSSDFLPIKKKILNYPGDEILLGFIRPVEDDKQLFYICTTVRSKNAVVEILNRQKAELREKLIASVYRVPHIWNSYGSEEEVDDSIIKNFRPLIQIEVESKYPLYIEKKKFRPRFVADAVDGYIEILPGRFPYTNVLRKRVDAAVQVSPSLIENEVQTNPAYPKNIYTQYNYEYTEPILNRFQYQYLNEFLQEHIASLDDTINVNENINLYTNEYMKIAKPIVRNSLSVNHDLTSFLDVVTCKDKTVAAIEVHPLISNIVAVSYSRFTFNKMSTCPTGEDDINVTIFGKHLVLIWCYSEPLKPKLFLHSYREICSLRFCPYNSNILIGGCSNGQIVIWDISGRLEKVETREILTPSEIKHRMIMQSMVTWMKNTYNISVVLPTVVSSIDGSHNALICNIRWMLREHKITKNGKVELCEPNETSFQFITSGMDGKILIWDLNSIPKPTETKMKKSQLLEKRPSALISADSDLKYLNNILTPIYKIYLRNKITNIPYPISAIFCSSTMSGFFFRPINLETENYFERTYYEIFKPEKIPDFIPKFGVADHLGNIFKCTFEGHDFDQGQKLNYENSHYSQFDTVHDGPIRSLRANLSDNNIVLTVGGRVFAVWDIAVPPKPLLYRKSKHRYVAGVWSKSQTCSIIVARSDSYLETWEFFHRSNTPAKIVRMSGNVIIDLYSDPTRYHRSKNTFFTVDDVGAVRLYKIIESRHHMTEEEQIKYVHILRDRIFHRRRKMKTQIEEYKRKYIKNTDEMKEEVVPGEAPADPAKTIKTEKQEKTDETIQKKSAIQTGNTWAEKQEKMMYRILLEKKKLNPAEIEKNKGPLQKLYEQQQHKGKKTMEMLAKKEDIFLASKIRVFKETEVKKKNKISVSFPKEIENTMKETFVDQYKNMLDEKLVFVKNNQFLYAFDWGAMIHKGKERRRDINTQFQIHSRNRPLKSKSVIYSDSLIESEEEIISN